MSKPYLSVVQQIRNLKDVKGLIINNESFAEEVLTDIGYFSLIGEVELCLDIMRMQS